MNSHALHFDQFLKEMKKKVKKYSKKETLWHGVLLYVLVSSKNDKLEFSQTFQNNTSQKCQSSTNMYKFQAK